MTNGIELEMCTRCEDKVDAKTLMPYLDWKLCEICVGDI